MDRNSYLLIIFYISTLLTLLTSCLGGNESVEENILELPDYYPTLEESSGKYFFIPMEDEFSNRNDFNYLNLKRGDTLFLEIKKDSTYFFNKIFFNQAENYDSLTGKVSLKNNIISINPDTEKIKIRYIFPRGFKKSTNSCLYFYYILSSTTDPTEFNYSILYKKMK